ncbi:uncharacterized protein BJ171DRAFT_614929 [Polychytrium aggregatum]|uniref:uncharacterized protein n=1 Tax=Polychytrium aggregatum TaxID=110093 RepID=UPI0022FF12E9|nr:uncharacterized protein BJ171DRAFT_614929 [Polychytrium aggregatum]KAI9205516.1 hypothetical protein BJ171DRAFT_614929 [Polychytrium aggregatum]
MASPLPEIPRRAEVEEAEGAGSPSGASNTTRSPITQAICLDLLIKGNIQSYVSFFQTAIENRLDVEYTQEPLTEYKDLLTAIENSKLVGDSARIYESLKRIAFYFQDLKDYDKSLSYFKESLSASKDIEEKQIEAAANMGRALEHCGYHEDALEYFVQSRSISKERHDKASETMASYDIVEACTRIAENLEKALRFENAIEQYTKCIPILEESCSDHVRLNDINYRLGLVYQRLGDMGKATEYLESFLEFTKRMDDKSKEGLGHAALAQCYESSGNPLQAAKALQEFVALTEADPTQRGSQADACNQLGVLYNKLGEYDLAVQYFDSHYRLTRELSVPAPPSAPASAHGKRPRSGQKLKHQDPSETVAGARAATKLDGAQVQLGISRGNSQMQAFFEAVKEQNTPALLGWKAARALST